MATRKPKMIITDVDGTYVNYNSRCSDGAHAAALKLKEKKIILVLATGRALTSIDYIKNIEAFDFLIGGNGSFIKDLNNSKILYKKFISKNNANSLIDKINKKNLIWVTEVRDKMVFSDKVNKKKFFYIRASETGYECVLSNSLNCEIPKLIIFSNTKTNDEVYRTLEIIVDQSRYTIYKSFTVCEITEKNTSKWKAALNLLKLHNIKEEDVWAIGDSANDLEMISNAGFSIAMGNASEHIKNAADFITRDVQNSGWKYAFEKLGVINE